MPYQVVWGQVNVFSKQGDRKTLSRGEYLPGELDELQVSQLSTIGAVQYVDTALPPAATLLASVVNAPLPDPTAQPEPADAEPLGDVVDLVIAGAGPAPTLSYSDDPNVGLDGAPNVAGAEPAAAPEPPAKNAPKAEWVDYATSQGVPRDEAESSSKQDLVDRFGG